MCSSSSTRAVVRFPPASREVRPRRCGHRSCPLSLLIGPRCDRLVAVAHNLHSLQLSFAPQLHLLSDRLHCGLPEK